MDERQLERELSRVYPGTVRALDSIPGDILVLGAGGKIGPSLCRLLKNAATAAVGRRRVIAISRFSNEQVRTELEHSGVQTIRADLLDRSCYDALPDAPNIFFLAGMKFGASGREDLTWAMNTHLPALVAERWCGTQTRIVVFSTGNVYPFTAVDSGGADERTPPQPVGEYAMSCLGRERIFRHFCTSLQTPTVIVRLNYASEMRYGVLVDLARKVLAGQPVDLTMGHVNVIWQGDANNYIAQALTLASCPADVLNVAGPQTVSVRALAAELAELAGMEVRFTGSEQPTALLSDSSRCVELFGPPEVSLQWLLPRVVDWLRRGGRILNKATKFQVRDGTF